MWCGYRWNYSKTKCGFGSCLSAILYSNIRCVPKWCILRNWCLFHRILLLIVAVIQSPEWFSCIELQEMLACNILRNFPALHSNFYLQGKHLLLESMRDGQKEGTKVFNHLVTCWRSAAVIDASHEPIYSVSVSMQSIWASTSISLMPPGLIRNFRSIIIALPDRNHLSHSLGLLLWSSMAFPPHGSGIMWFYLQTWPNVGAVC